MTAAQPYRDPTYPPRQRRSVDPLLYARDKQDQNSEFGFGAGLVPQHLNGVPPSQGGVYMPRCPAVDVGPILAPYTSEVVPYQPRRPRREARGHPGEQVRR
jgi:hypothetical protein